MTISTGRSGTGLLAELFALTEDMCSVHEPVPTFQNEFEALAADPDHAVRFCRDVKLPAIAALPGRFYAESSHYFGQGFFEAFVRLDVPFKLVILNRDPRAVAKSFERIKCVPVKTDKGRELMPHPGGESALSVDGWEGFSDYQLCYWYCLETERRKDIALARCGELGLGVVEIDLEGLRDFEQFSAMTAALGLTLSEDAQAAHAELAATKVNRKGKYMPKLRLANLDEREAEVWAAVDARHPDFRAAFGARYPAS